MSTQRVASMLFSIALLLVLLLFLAFSKRVSEPQENQIEIINLPMATTITKPMTNSQLPAPSLQNLDAGVNGLVAMAVDMPMQQFNESSIEWNLNMPSIDFSVDDALPLTGSQGIEITEVAQLDEVPRLLTPVNIRMPKQLAKKLTKEKIERVLIKLSVLIDESGLVQLLSIKQNPYPVLNEQVQMLIKRTRFTVPLKDGKKVKSQFIWPIEVNV